AGNFARALPGAALLAAVALAMGALRLDVEGALLAATSGALASGVGYAVWYAALRRLPATEAGIVQLSVPVLAALGGVLILAEPVTLRLVLASVIVLGGVGLALGLGRRGAN
ncbi:MAG: DMT family transporter, partial [Candidatus Eisenbacteria bacterium]